MSKIVGNNKVPQHVLQGGICHKRIRRACRCLKAQKPVKGFLRGRDPDQIDQLRGIKPYKIPSARYALTPADACPPGKIPPQFIGLHLLVGHKDMPDRYAPHTVVIFIIRHVCSLLQKRFGPLPVIRLVGLRHLQELSHFLRKIPVLRTRSVLPAAASSVEFFLRDIRPRGAGCAGSGVPAPAYMAEASVPGSCRIPFLRRKAAMAAVFTTSPPARYRFVMIES